MIDPGPMVPNTLYFIVIYGAGGGTRTHTLLRKTDFKSVASTIPPRPPVVFLYTVVARLASASAQ